MSFMQKQITGKQKWFVVETQNGSEVIPYELLSNVSECPTREDVEANPLWFAAVEQYCESEPLTWEIVEGHGARLSAPGYTDCTSWSVYDTPQEAEQALEDMYPDEDEDSL